MARENLIELIVPHLTTESQGSAAEEFSLHLAPATTAWGLIPTWPAATE